MERTRKGLKMEITVQVGVIAALVLALASIAGGVVLFRGSRRVGWRALGMSAIAGGVGVLVVFALLLPLSSEGQASEPIVGKVVSTRVVYVEDGDYDDLLRNRST